eukprot:TRINITY_DN38166_c0_g1_i1.p1 TRINITY_DN38166_c0_g1~~TRINITY_DN38166_c0_g1_i1.p1  ORF type:complete len:475 (+),score=61.19 TRINITY_DN38166_c0_g1_i1:57-1481(+)
MGPKKPAQPQTLSGVLKLKNRADAFAKYVENVLDVTEGCSGFESYDATMRAGFVKVVKEVLMLGQVAGKPDAVVEQLKEVLGKGVELRYYALSAAGDLLDTSNVENSVGEKRKMTEDDIKTPPHVIENILCLLHKTQIPTKKGDEMAFYHQSYLVSMRDEQKAALKDSTALMKARSRNKKLKEGWLSLFTPSVYQRAFTEFWMKLLSTTKDHKTTLRILETLHEDVMPYLSSPLMLFDFLSDCLSEGGLAGILALNGLFDLITVHGLEYPSFFDKLYTLLTPDVCVMEHRGLFFELVGKFLCSLGLSSGLIAAFVKRSCRLALHAPTPAVFFLISLVKMLLLRHPQVMPLIHRTKQVSPEDAAIFAGTDPYDPTVALPEASHALHSSCWELRALLNHYNPTISSTAKELLDELKQPIGGSIPLVISRASRTYQKMITRELMKEISGIPSSAYARPVGFTSEEYKLTSVGAGFSF